VAIRAVLFDIDGTLYDRDAAMLSLADEQYAVFRDRMNGVGKSAFVARLLEIDDHGYRLRSEVYARLAEEFGLDNTLAVELERHFWQEYARRCDVSDDTRLTLETLRSAGKKLGVISNGQTKWQMTKLEGLGLARCFDTILISESEGIRKPDPRIFHLAVERLGVAPHEAMFVGDQPQVDAEGAHNAGLVGVWKRMPYWKRTIDDVLVVDRLSEILEHVRQA
jgi:putative hydrolase of the HAD superfamily